ncbi:MAG: HEPN domain-containing protein [Candidatus Omnitrophica bacterium]|nr:HEPN domain-containing protein [Candidatus Omnitrophota bacterium]
MAKEEINEWISKATKDLEEAKFLFDHNRPLEDSAYFVHQAIEKYLKAFLISKDWELEKIHDLVKLIKDASKFDKSFEKFISAMEEITDFYIESRYPVGYEVEYTKEEIEKAIKVAEALQELIKEKIKNF